MKVLQECLDCIYQRTKIPYELIVVDNHSTDGTAEYLKTQQALGKLTYIRTESNVGVTARNLALREIESPFIAQIDDDALVQLGWDTNHVALLKGNPLIGMVGQQGGWIRKWLEIDVAYGDNYNVDCLTGYFMVFRNLGLLYDEALAPFWHEDLQLSLEYKMRGYKICVVPSYCAHASKRTNFDVDIHGRNWDYIFQKYEPFIEQMDLEGMK